MKMPEDWHYGICLTVHLFKDFTYGWMGSVHDCYDIFSWYLYVPFQTKSNNITALNPIRS